MTDPAAAQFRLRSEAPRAFELRIDDLSGYSANAHSLYLNYEAQGRLLRVKDALCGKRFAVELAPDQSYAGRFLCDDSKAPPSGAFIDLRSLEGARLDILWGGKDPDRRASKRFEDWLAGQHLLYRRHRVAARCLNYAPTHSRRAAVRFNFALENDSELGQELELILYFDAEPGPGAVLAALGIGPGRDTDCIRQRLQLTLDVQQAPSRFIHLVAASPQDP